jgi:gamma-glutamylcyclotransferase (GGCT)/AIG2-like uncharacterized protein YtfP
MEGACGGAGRGKGVALCAGSRRGVVARVCGSGEGALRGFCGGVGSGVRRRAGRSVGGGFGGFVGGERGKIASRVGEVRCESRGRSGWRGGEVPADGEGRSAFVYGSLLFGSVLEALLGRVPESREGRVSGWHRFQVRGQVYPAVAAVEGSEVVGKVLLGLSGEEKDVLDWFEDEEYVKVPVTVEPCGTQAWIYARDAVGEDLYGAWDVGAFERDHLESFTEMCVGCREEYLRTVEAERRGAGGRLP